MQACNTTLLKIVLPELEDINLVTINGDYVFEGNLNVDALFKFCSVKKDATSNWDFIADRIKQAKATIENPSSPRYKSGRALFPSIQM
jgi:hypothetical protein